MYLRRHGMFTHLLGSMQTLNVPKTDSGIVRATDQVAIHERAPSKTIALSFVPYQPGIWSANGVCGLGRMLAVVKNIHLRTDGLGGNDKGVLRHVACPVDFTLVIDLLDHLDLACSSGSRI